MNFLKTQFYPIKTEVWHAGCWPRWILSTPKIKKTTTRLIDKSGNVTKNRKAPDAGCVVFGTVTLNPNRQPAYIVERWLIRFLFRLYW
jgi:hypothetical protein